MGSPALAGPAKQCFSLPTTPRTAAPALRGARTAAARGRVNLGPARAQGPPGRRAFEKAEGKTNVLRNPFKKYSYTSVCAWRDVRETRAYIPSVRAAGAGGRRLPGHLRPDLGDLGDLGERGRVLAPRPGGRGVARLPSSRATLSPETCAEPRACMPGKLGQTSKSYAKKVQKQLE